MKKHSFLSALAMFMMVLQPNQSLSQGTVVFNNRVTGAVIARVYVGGITPRFGNGATDFPTGTTDWTGYTLAAGPEYKAQLLAAPGQNTPEYLLVPSLPVTTFRTGTAAGFVAPATSTLAIVPKDAAVATVQMVVWHDPGNLYPSWEQALPAWQSGFIAAAKSPVFNLQAIGGDLNVPPNLVGLQSFNIMGGWTPSIPYIVVQPEDLAIALHQEAFFFVMAQSPTLMSYQWRRNLDPIPGATDATLRIMPVEETDAGLYDVVVANSYGSVNSRQAQLTVILPPDITTQPATQTVSDGEPVTFRADVQGSPPFHYQWFFGSAIIPGATQSSYTIAQTLLSHQGSYSAIVSNQAGVAHSEAAILTVLPVPPRVTTQPTGQIALVNSPVTLQATVAGSEPLFLQWTKDGALVPGATRAELVIPEANLLDSGVYTLTASNSAGTAVSDPEGLDVRPVFIYGDGQLLLGSNYSFVGSVEIGIVCGFEDGLVFFTIDGSEPDFAGRSYQAPFTLHRSVTLRAMAYSWDFMEQGQAPPVQIDIVPAYPLSVGTKGGGKIILEPSLSAYPSNSLVTVNAIPDEGWTFMGWLGHAEDDSNVIQLLMDREKCLEAVFGTTLSVTAAGAGQVLRQPEVLVYPYGTTLQLTGIPGPGSYFGTWGPVSSTVNPLTLTVTNPNPAISCLFSALPAGQVAFTAVADGIGTISVSTRSNRFPAGSSVQLTALPRPGQEFLGWSGDYSGAQNPVWIALDGSKTVVARFSRRAWLHSDGCLFGWTKDSFQLGIGGQLGEAYLVEKSGDLLMWVPAGLATNALGTAQFLDQAPAAENRFYRASEAEH